MTPALAALLAQWHAELDRHLESRLPRSALPGAGALNEAVRYAVFPGGRRWRPALTLLGAAAADTPARLVMDAACGVEFVHTASLILDDLPSMDDGRERRGRPTLHLAFGEGLALLAALALLNRGYELFLSPVFGVAPAHGQRLLQDAISAIGVNGMIGGQAADLARAGRPPLASRDRKTTTLVSFAAAAGAIAGGAAEEAVAALARYGESLGSAYQMLDDLLDEDGDGTDAKTSGQDARHGRPSWAAATSRATVRAAAAAAHEEARATILSTFGHRAEAALLLDAAAAILDLTGRPAVPVSARG
jgi:geranylgeranyl diphosphate synthase type II